MKMKRSFVLSIAALLIAITMGWAALSAEAQLPGGAGPDVPGSEEQPYHVSDSPWLRLPEDMLDWPPVEPSRPADVIEVEDPTAVEIYNAATGEVVRIPSDHPSQQGKSGLDAAPPYASLLPPDVGESVLGPDDRVYVSAVTTFPWRTIVKLFITFPDGASGGCSGAIIGCPDGHGYHVLTAGHCAYSHDHSGWATSIKVVPGLDWDYMPYNYAWMTDMWSYAGWTVSGMSEHDWAMLTLDRNVGDHTGWMGRMWAGSSSSIYTDILNTAGYPGDLSSGLRMYWNSNNGDSADDHNHWYYMDTAGGQSGAPVWRYASGNRYILTIHTCGTAGCGVGGKGCNHGTRLNEDKFNRIYTWCDGDTPPTDYADLIDDGQAYSGFSPTQVRPGATSFHVWSDVRNIGTTSSGGFYVRYYASTNTTITTYDYLIGTDYVSSISAFNYRDSDLSLTFPTGIPDGTYWVGWIVDGYDNVTEFDETNNIAYKDSYQLLVDGTAPSNPTSCTETHGAPHDTWQHEVSDPAFTWSGASDGSGSGVAGYLVYWGTNPSGTPSTWRVSASYNPPAVSDPGTYYLRVRTVDNVGNTSGTTTLFIFRYEATLLLPLALRNG